MDRDVLLRIKDVLKTKPRGMSVTDIADAIGKNRQSVAKYMEMLVITGQVDVKAFGPSKAFYLSHRLPISAILNLSSGFIIVLDHELNVIHVNDHFLDFADVKRDDIIYKKFDKFAFPMEFEPPIIPNVYNALSGAESTIEAQYGKVGTRLYFNIKFIPMVLDDGEQGVTIFFDDVTERRRIDEAHAQLAAIVEASSDGIISKTLDGIIISWNKGARRIYGYEPEEIIGKPSSILVPKDRINDIPQILEKIRNGEDVIYHNARRVRKDGRIIDVSLTASPIKDLEGRIVGAAITSRDITKSN